MNPGPNYLSSGDAVLPLVFLISGGITFILLVVWIAFLRSHREQVHSIHHIMTVLLLFKFLVLFADSMRYHYMKTRGDSLAGWNLLFYIFTFFKGIILFTVLLLIGTGWSFIKVRQPHAQYA